MVPQFELHCMLLFKVQLASSSWNQVLAHKKTWCITLRRDCIWVLNAEGWGFLAHSPSCTNFLLAKNETEVNWSNLNLKLPQPDIWWCFLHPGRSSLVSRSPSVRRKWLFQTYPLPTLRICVHVCVSVQECMWERGFSMDWMNNPSARLG